MKTTNMTLCAALALTTWTAGAQDPTSEPGGQRGGKTLVVYFSATGTTRQAALKIARATGGDLHEIRPAKPYTAADLDWHDEQSRSSVEMRDRTSRPAIAARAEHLDAYDTLFIGFPIWWYVAPTIVNTFIERHDLRGKTLIPFATSGGSTIHRAQKELQERYPELRWKPGRLLNGASQERIAAWLDELGIAAEGR